MLQKSLTITIYAYFQENKESFEGGANFFIPHH